MAATTTRVSNRRSAIPRGQYANLPSVRQGVRAGSQAGSSSLPNDLLLGVLQGGLQGAMGGNLAAISPGLLSGFTQSIQSSQANAANAQRLQEVLGIYDQMSRATADPNKTLPSTCAGQYETGINRMTFDRDRALAEAERGGGEMLSAISKRNADILGNLEGMGEQAARDIREDYRKQGATQAQGLVSRGLGGTTIGASLQSAIERQQQDALNRLNESVRTQKTNLQTGLSSDYLSQLSSNVQNRAGIAGQYNQAMTNFALNQFPTQLAFQQGIGDRAAATLSGVTNAGPAAVNWGDIFASGQNTSLAQQIADQRTSANWWAPALGAGGNIGGAALGAWMLS